MSDNFITLATFTYPAEAYPLMARLRADGIECFLADENTINVHPFISNAIGGVKIKIKESDAQKAMEIINSSK